MWLQLPCENVPLKGGKDQGDDRWRGGEEAPLGGPACSATWSWEFLSMIRVQMPSFLPLLCLLLGHCVLGSLREKQWNEIHGLQAGSGQIVSSLRSSTDL